MLEQNVNALPFVENMVNIKLLDELINKDELENDFEEVIKSFENSYNSLKTQFKISIPNKIHVMISHLSTYLKNSGESLKKVTDQTIEATHSKLDQFLRSHGYFRKNIESEEAGDKLHDWVLAWNSYVLGDS